LYPTLETQIYTCCDTSHLTADPLNCRGTTGLGARGHIWFGIKEYNRFGVIPFEMPSLGKYELGTGVYEGGMSLPPPFLLCNAQPISGSGNHVTIQCGHVREGADLSNLTWADLIVDQQFLNPLGLDEYLCASGSQPPEDYSSATVSASLNWFRPWAPGIVEGRRASYHLTFRCSGLTQNKAGIPYVRVVEVPDYWIGAYNSEGTLYWQIFDAQNSSDQLTLNIRLTREIISKGYFTVEYGHVVPVSGQSIFMVAQTVKDGDLQVPLQFTAANIQNLQVRTVTPPVSAKIGRLDVKLSAPAVAAKITRLDVKLSAPQVAAAIRRIDVKSTAAVVAAAIRRLDIKTSSGPPPPPPSEYATLMGTVLNSWGQPVTNCQVSLIGGTSASTTTADDGTFEIDNIPVGTYTLIATPTNLFDKLILKGTSMPIDLTLPTGYSQDVTLNLNTLNLAVGGAALFTGIGVAAYETSKPKTYGGYR
jgi:hypothetical protein